VARLVDAERFTGMAHLPNTEAGADLQEWVLCVADPERKPFYEARADAAALHRMNAAQAGRARTGRVTGMVNGLSWVTGG
jgi:hypothetical protein